jgi:hypothetical protein
MQRYDCEECDSRFGGRTYYDHKMVPDPDGDYCLFSDAQAEIDRLTAERDEDRRREYGYSQQTVDALSKERVQWHDLCVRQGVEIKGLTAEVDDWKREYRLERDRNRCGESVIRDNEALTKANMRLRGLLGKAEQAIHSEYCTSQCNPLCIEIAEALKEAE